MAIQYCDLTLRPGYFPKLCSGICEGIGTKSRTKNFRKGRIVYAIRPNFALSKQLAASLLITSLDDQLATSLLTTCNRLVGNKLSQAMR